MCFRKIQLGTSGTASAESFQNFVIMFSTPENLLVGISGALGIQECHILSWNMCLEEMQ